MIANRGVAMALNRAFRFSTKKQMELTIRFSRLITKTQQSTLVIQNRCPPALHILPPGSIRLKFSQDTKALADQYLHTGGWLIVHTDNTVEVDLMDAFQKKEVKIDQIDKSEQKDSDSPAAKYIAKFRRSALKIFTRRASES